MLDSGRSHYERMAIKDKRFLTNLLICIQNYVSKSSLIPCEKHESVHFLTTKEAPHCITHQTMDFPQAPIDRAEFLITIMGFNFPKVTQTL